MSKEKTNQPSHRPLRDGEAIEPGDLYLDRIVSQKLQDVPSLFFGQRQGTDTMQQIYRPMRRPAGKG